MGSSRPGPPESRRRSGNPTSLSTSRRPTNSAAAGATNPCVGAPTVSVQAARTAAPRGLPESPSSPAGTSTATIGHFKSLSASMNWIHGASRSRLSPMPKRPSTHHCGSHPEAISWSRDRSPATGSNTSSIRTSRSRNPDIAARTSSPLCPRPASRSSRSPGFVRSMTAAATRLPTC